MNGNLMVIKSYKSNMMHEDVNNEDDDDDSKQKISGAPLTPLSITPAHPNARVCRLNPAHVSIKRKSHDPQTA